MILTAVDDHLLPQAATLIKSCARHAPGQGFYLLAVNSPPRRLDRLRRCHPRLTIEPVRWAYQPERWRGLMCAARSGPILHLLESCRQPVLYLDSDTLLRRPVDGLFARLESVDLLVKYRPQCLVRGPAGTTKAARFNSGVIAIRPSAEGLAFARAYHQRIRQWIDSGRPLSSTDPACGINTCIDQELLYLVYEEHKQRLSFAPLPEKYNDSTFAPDSVIWHGKGTARRHPAYLAARLSYGPRAPYYAFSLLAPPLRLAYRLAGGIGRGRSRR